MGKSNQRQVFFEKHIRNEPTADGYVNALKNSPYRTHQRMALVLNPMLESLKKKEDSYENPIS